MRKIDQVEIWAQVAQAAINYIVINSISSSNQKQTVTDMKTDLRTTKEDLMQQIKESEQEILGILNARNGDNG